jgi:ABC-type glycerol-3-phosphate transport system permease component
MIANFIALGVVGLALAAAVGRTIGDRPSGWVATAAIGLLGAAFVVAGVCVTDPSRLVSGAHTWHGVVHALMATIIFLIATPIAALAIARRLRRRRRFARYSVLTAVGTPALLVATFSSKSLLGLGERIVIAVVLAWLTSLALQLRHGDLARC